MGHTDAVRVPVGSSGCTHWFGICRGDGPHCLCTVQAHKAFAKTNTGAGVSPPPLHTHNTRDAARAHGEAPAPKRSLPQKPPVKTTPSETTLVTVRMPPNASALFLK